MPKALIFLLLFSFFGSVNLAAQKEMKIYSSKFIPQEITYNASPNPNECWEAVAWGIEIKVEKGTQFFSMSYRDIDSLKKIIGDAEVQIEVIYYSEMEEGSGAVGEVVKITLGDVVVYKRE